MPSLRAGGGVFELRHGLCGGGSRKGNRLYDQCPFSGARRNVCPMSGKRQGSARITGRAEERRERGSRASDEGRHKSKRLTWPPPGPLDGCSRSRGFASPRSGACSSAGVLHPSEPGPGRRHRRRELLGEHRRPARRAGALDVTSIITNPNTDPHDYEPTAQDALKIASAQLVIENGVGYDPWVDRLLGASSVKGRLVLNVGGRGWGEAGRQPSPLVLSG